MQEKIEKLLSSLTPSQVKKFSAEVSERYRKRQTPFLLKKEHRLAYLATRFPATFAVAEKVFEQIKDLSIHSLLDVGAGPGTGFLAARQVFSSLSHATLLERDEVFIEIARQLIGTGVLFMRKDFCQMEDLKSHDLVLFSYSLGEAIEKEQEAVIKRAWDLTEKALVVIEPGTPQGFERIRFIREKLLSWGAYLAGPCPHAAKCPMEKGDWCHFFARLSRNSLHRFAKEGTLGFEDEKFSYLIATREKRAPYAARILRHPHKGEGFISFSLCTSGGLKNKVVTKKEGIVYKSSKKLQWGDIIDY